MPNPETVGKWRVIGIERKPIDGHTRESCFWVKASDGKRSRYLNVAIPPALERIPAKEAERLARFAVCAECGWGYSDLILAALQAPDLPDDERPCCGGCAWELVAVKAVALQREAGVFLGISDSMGGDNESERESRRRILRGRAEWFGSGGVRVIRRRELFKPTPEPDAGEAATPVPAETLAA